VTAHLREHGYDFTLIRVEGLSITARNALLIRDALKSMPAEGGPPRIVLIGYSKGSNDILEALVSYPELRPRVAAVVSADLIDPEAALQQAEPRRNAQRQSGHLLRSGGTRRHASRLPKRRPLGGCATFVLQKGRDPEPGGQYVVLTTPIIAIGDTQEHLSTGYPLHDNYRAVDAYVEVTQRPWPRGSTRPLAAPACRPMSSTS
jgi:hypothetical protein